MDMDDVEHRILEQVDDVLASDAAQELQKALRAFVAGPFRESFVRMVVAMCLANAVMWGYWAMGRLGLWRGEARQHLYFAVTGILLTRWLVGQLWWEMVKVTLATYAAMFLSGPTVATVFAVCTVCAGFILWGGDAVLSGTGENDPAVLVDFTVLQYVLVMKVVAVAFDYYDGNKHNRLVSKSQEETKVQIMPNLLELTAYVFFPATVANGPFVPLKVHRDLIETAEEKIERRRRTKRISATVAAEVRWRRRRTAGLFVVGLLYAVVYYYAHQVDWEGDGDVDVDQPESGLLALVLLHAWNAKLALMRYVTVWLLADAALSITGLDLRNMHVWNFEFGSTFADVKNSWNIQTCYWIEHYVTSRLPSDRWDAVLGSFTVATFLATGRGWWGGYMVSLVMELASLHAMGQVTVPLKGGSGFVAKVLVVVRWVWLRLILVYSMVALTSAGPSQTLNAYAKLYFVGHFVLAGAIASHRLLGFGAGDKAV